MEEESNQKKLLFTADGVIVKNDADFPNNVGTLNIVDHGSDLWKCIEWNQCDVSFENSDPEWVVVKQNKYKNGSHYDDSKNPSIRIPFRNLLKFSISNDNKQVTLIDSQKSTVFYFPNNIALDVINFLKASLKTTVLKRNPSSYIVIDQKEVQALEKSFTELKLFPDDNTKKDVLRSFFETINDRPYEKTMCAFSKVTQFSINTFLNKSPVRERDSDFTSEICASDLPDVNSKLSIEDNEITTKKVPLPQRSSPLSLEQWTQFFDEEGRILEPDSVKKIIFRGGVSNEGHFRPEVWKFLLDYYPWNSTYAEREALRKQKEIEYFTMKKQWQTMSATQEDNFTKYKEKKSLIEKDVYRTDRNVQFFAGENNKNIEVLQDVLRTYLMYNFDLGYVQGMSDLLAPLLFQIVDEVDTFWCFVGFMNKVKQNFDLNQFEMKVQLRKLYDILRSIEPEFALHLKQQDSNTMSFCFRWLLLWFKREFDYDKIFILWEVLWTGLPVKNFHLMICAAILVNEKNYLMDRNCGLTEILKHVNELAYKINLEDTLSKAERIYLQLTTATETDSDAETLSFKDQSQQPEQSLSTSILDAQEIS